MRVAEADILIVPGWGNSGPDHWQTRWQTRLSTARRVEQAEWERPMLDAWVEALCDAVAAAVRPVVLVAHSLGVTTVAHAAGRFETGRVAGAFLVAPPSAGFLSATGALDPAFAGFPRDRLPFPSVLVASSSDVHCGFDEATRLAADWGSELIDAGDAGHINAASGHGPWPEGLIRFAGLLSAS